MATRSSPVWTFTKINPGPTDMGPVTLTLGGWSAPFGRPRNGEIFNAGIKIQRSRTDYPGRDVPPTIHAFSSQLKDVDVHGRWMDQAIGTVGGAQKYIANWKAFVKDQRVVRVSWGGIISYQIFIHDMDMKMEGPGDVVWRMQADTLVDEQAVAANLTFSAIATPFDMATAMSKYFPSGVFFPSAFISPSLSAMLSQITDSLSTLVSQLNTPFQYIYNTCSAISSFETAISSDLTGLSSGVSAMQTGILQLRQQTDFLLSNAVLLNVSDAEPLNGVNGGIVTGSDMTALTAAKQSSDYAASQILKLMTQMQAQIDKFRRGVPASAYIAKSGDTWEQISINILGNASGARKIKAYNGVRYGEQPNAGQQYTIPKA